MFRPRIHKCWLAALPGTYCEEFRHIHRVQLVSKAHALRGRLYLLVVLTIAFVSCASPTREPQRLVKEIFGQITPPTGANLLYSNEFKSDELNPRYEIWGLYGADLDDTQLQEYYKNTLTQQGWKVFAHMESGYPMYCRPGDEHVVITMVNRAAYLYDLPAPADVLAKAKTNYRTLFSVDAIYGVNSPTECLSDSK